MASARCTDTRVMNQKDSTYIRKRDNPFPSGSTQPEGSWQRASKLLGERTSFLASVQHDLYSICWSFSRQQALPDNTFLELVYAGKHAVHLPSSDDINTTKLHCRSMCLYLRLPLETLNTLPHTLFRVPNLVPTERNFSYITSVSKHSKPREVGDCLCRNIQCLDDCVP